LHLLGKTGLGHVTQVTELLPSKCKAEPHHYYYR
jgi:hypothetical protein